MKEFIQLLKEFVAIKSVSADPQYKSEIIEAGKWLNNFAQRAGLKTQIISGFDNPIVIAKTPKIEGAKTILIYGHYDVQPASKEDGWKTDPFILSEKNGKLFGRGSADNKGQILTHLYTVANLLKEKRLGYNITFMIEGNEETGSPNLKKFIDKNKKLLACDCIVISDGDLGENITPALEASFRGVANVEIFFKTAEDDFHSGLFGGLKPNAAEELGSLLGKLHGKDRRILVHGFYAGIKNIGRDRTGLEPAIEVTTLVAGYLGDGFRNSIPSKASAKMNIRSAPNQDPKKLSELLKKFLLKNKPSFAKLEYKANEATRGASLSLDNEFARRAKKILEEVYNKKVLTKHSGGTLPIVNDFEKILKVPQVMIPLANFDCGMHSASENIEIRALQKGLLFSARFLTK